MICKEQFWPSAYEGLLGGGTCDSVMKGGAGLQGALQTGARERHYT